MEYTFKLKHLEELISSDPDYPKIMAEVCGYNNNWIGRKWVFVWKFRQAYALMQKYKNLSPKGVEENPNCNIKRPQNIDNISFMAMMDLQRLSTSNSEDPSFLLAEMIAKACYGENVEGDYDSTSEKYLEFREKVLDEPLLDMLGLFNWIDKDLNRSTEFWTQKFAEVHVEDKDFQMAGGDRLDAFNVINTIKTICNDFNLTYEQAWQMSYSLTQVNSLAKATTAYVQEQMREIKEARMKRQREQKNY